ncbi:MAG: hypothetical protein N0E56_18295, partial [Candidatus Thiodiazotropha endolucinida]|nr:hypothetical protein [Candidatus Thiodiazotropha taylori]MCW4268564.1 hypothetical protein [Candidatus Thiodiazotropha endolucinida]
MESIVEPPHLTGIPDLISLNALLYQNVFPIIQPMQLYLLKSKTTRRAGGMMKAPGGGYVRVQPISSAPG